MREIEEYISPTTVFPLHTVGRKWGWVWFAIRAETFKVESRCNDRSTTLEFNVPHPPDQTLGSRVYDMQHIVPRAEFSRTEASYQNTTQLTHPLIKITHMLPTKINSDLTSASYPTMN